MRSEYNLKRQREEKKDALEGREESESERVRNITLIVVVKMRYFVTFLHLSMDSWPGHSGWNGSQSMIGTNIIRGPMVQVAGFGISSKRDRKNNLHARFPCMCVL